MFNTSKCFNYSFDIVAWLSLAAWRLAGSIEKYQKKDVVSNWSIRCYNHSFAQ